MREHTWYECPKPCHDAGRCKYCDGGLTFCTTCGGIEGSLLDECPGEWLTAEQHEWNYQGNLRRWDKQAKEARR